MFFTIYLGGFLLKSLRTYQETVGRYSWFNTVLGIVGRSETVYQELEDSTSNLFVAAFMLGVIVVDIGAIIICIAAWKDIILKRCRYSRINTSKVPLQPRPTAHSAVHRPLKQLTLDRFLVPRNAAVIESRSATATGESGSAVVQGLDAVLTTPENKNILSNLYDEDDDSFDYLRCIHEPSESYLKEYSQSLYDDFLKDDVVTELSTKITRTKESITAHSEDEDEDDDFDYLACIHEPTESDIKEYNQSLYNDFVKDSMALLKINLIRMKTSTNALSKDDDGDEDDDFDYLRCIVEPSDEYLKEYNQSLYNDFVKDSIALLKINLIRMKTSTNAHSKDDEHNRSLLQGEDVIDECDELEENSSINWSEEPVEDADPAAIPEWAVIPDWDFNRMG